MSLDLHICAKILVAFSDVAPLGALKHRAVESRVPVYLIAKNTASQGGLKFLGKGIAWVRPSAVRDTLHIAKTKAQSYPHGFILHQLVGRKQSQQSC